MKFRHVLFGLSILVVVFFFWREFQINWPRFSQKGLHFSYSYLFAGWFMVCAAYLVSTWTWRESLAKISGVRLSFRESFALYNSGQLNKYIPGKVWGWGLQAYWLSLRDVPMMLVISVNLVMTLSVLAASTLVGLGYLVYQQSTFTGWYLFWSFSVLFAGYLAFVLGGAFGFNLTIKLVNRFFSKRYQQIRLHILDMLRIHFYNMLSSLLYGFSAYFVALGIGEPWNIFRIIPVISSLLLADSIGFLALFSPGGLGVRELIMYGMLDKVIAPQTALLLPFVFRVITMSVDFILGGVALWNVRHYLHISQERASRPNIL